MEESSMQLEWANLMIQKREAQIQWLEERLRQRRIQVLGPHSETLSDLQLELLAEVEPSATRDEVEAEARREPLPQRPARERNPPGRKPPPENLPRIEQVASALSTGKADFSQPFQDRLSAVQSDLMTEMFQPF
jgi:hypothetical protein